MDRGIRTPSFLDHAPVSLTFGTSGLRGLVKDITDLEAYINVKGALRYLAARGDIRVGGIVVLAGNLRPSTDRIMRAAARAILDAGFGVENAGKIPTPAVILRGVSTQRAAVMVSGSHIPFDRNGIKISKPLGEILKSDEVGIVTEVERVRAFEYGLTADTTAFTPSGMLKAPLDLPPPNPSAEERYAQRYLGAFAADGLRGRRVLVYEHSAVGRDLLGRILSELGAEVVTAGRAETFVPIDTENVTPDLLQRLEAFAAAEGSGRLDAIVSTDGDSDRPLVAAVVPADPGAGRSQRVRFLPGDLLGIVVAQYVGADAVVVPISANDAVERRMRERGTLLRTTKIGSPYVVAGIEALRREGAYARVVGWEANGGFLVGSALTLRHGALNPLPTRDATLPILANLFAAAEESIGMTGLWDRLPARFGGAGLIDDVPVAVSHAIMAGLVPSGTPFDVRFEGTEVVFGSEGATPGPLGKQLPAAWRERKATLAGFFTPARGFGEIVRVNVLDGVRIYFDGGDVAHIRPSGNAPQLRIYANSDTQARADDIVASGLHEPDGILRSMERAFS